MLEVAEAIIEQLGGQKFVAMTGAKYLLGARDGLMFKIPGSMTKDGVNHVKITLDSLDTYTVEFSKLWGTSVIKKHEFHMIHADNLRYLFTLITGLDCGGIR